MSLTMMCPCGHNFDVPPEAAGRKVRCPKCQELMRVPMDESPSEHIGEQLDLTKSDDELPTEEIPGEALVPIEEPAAKKRPKRKEKKAKKQGLRSVGVGLLFHVGQLIFWLVALLLSIMDEVYFLAAASSADDDATIITRLEWMAYGILGLRIGAGLLGAIGSVLCCRVPPKSGARGTIILVLILDAIYFSIEFGAVFLFGPINAENQTLALIVAAVNGLVYMCSLVAYFSFLHKLADFLGEEGLAHDAQVQTVRAVVLPFCTVLLPLVWLFAIWLAMPGPRRVTARRFLLKLAVWAFAIGATVTLLVYWFVFLLRYWHLLFGLREAVRD